MTRNAPRPGQRVQLHRAVAKLGWGSRAQAWEWIVAGAIRVDGRTVREPLTWVDLDQQSITREDGGQSKKQALTLALHKPRGVVVTRRDERGRRTVYDLLPADLPWLHPAGRLDADSEGLLIVTNDSALSARLTDPQRHVPKTYRVTLSGALDDDGLARLRHGVELSDGPTRPTRVRVLRQGNDECEIEVILTEGRNRQIRRMVRAVGQQVRRLVRVAIGRLPLGDLPPGAWRALTEEELASAFDRIALQQVAAEEPRTK